MTLWMFGKAFANWGGEHADPVEMDTGNFVDNSNDMPFSESIYGMEWIRSYNSMDDSDGPHGLGWTSSYEEQLKPVDSNPATSDVVFRGANGRYERFANTGSGEWERVPHLSGGLVRGTDGCDTDRYCIAFDSGELWQFDEEGLLESKSDGLGQTVTVIRNGSGDIERVESSTGRWIDVTYNPENRVESVSAGMGGDTDRIVEYVYDAADPFLLLEASAPRVAGETTWSVTDYTYDSRGRIADITLRDSDQPFGSGMLRVANEYDMATGRVIQQETDSGDVIEFTYDPDTGESTATDLHSGDTTVYVHSQQGQLLAVRDANGQEVNRTWDGSGGLQLFADRRDARSGATFDSYGRVVQRAMPDPVTGHLPERNPDGTFPQPGGSDGWSLETFSYVATGDPRLETHTNAVGDVTRYTYAGDDRMPETVTAGYGTDDAEVVMMTYTDGKSASRTDGDGVTVCFEYNSAGDLDRQTMPFTATGDIGQACSGALSGGGVETFSYSPAGWMESRTAPDADGSPVTWSWSHDGLGRVRTADAPVPGALPEEYDYWPDGRLRSHTDANGDTRSVAWEARVDEVSTCGSAGVPCSIETITDPASVQTRSIYDASGDLREQIEAYGTSDAASTSFDYGPLARLETVTDPVGMISQFCYDANGNQTAIVEGLQAPVSCEDLSGTRATVSEYDLRNRLVAEVDPTGVRTEYRHDAADRVTHSIEAAGTPEESVSETIYDAAGRVSETRKPPPNVITFDWWDPANEDAKHITKNSYTAGGRVESVTRPNPNLGYWEENPLAPSVSICCSDEDFVWSETVTERYTYNEAGQLKETFSPLADLDPTDEHGPEVRHYDAAGDLHRIVSPAGREVVYHRDPSGRVEHLQRSVGDGQWSVASTVHDPLGRVLAESEPYADLGNPPSNLAWTEFEYHSSGLLETVTDPLGGKTDYSYDLRGNRTQRDSYDPDPPPGQSGELVINRWSYDPADRLVEQWRAPGSAPEQRDHLVTYDYQNPTTTANDGFLHARHDGSGRVQTYQYDLAGRPTEVTYTRPAESDSYSLAYAYDGGGRLVSMTDSRDPGNPMEQNWDVLGHLVQQSWSGSTAVWSWGERGNMLSRSSPPIPGTEAMLYDLDGRRVHSFVADQSLAMHLASWDYDPDALPVSDTHLEFHWVDAVPQIDFFGRQHVFDDAGRLLLLEEVTLKFPESETVHYLTNGLERDVTGRVSGEEFELIAPESGGSGHVVDQSWACQMVCVCAPYRVR